MSRFTEYFKATINMKGHLCFGTVNSSIRKGVYFQGPNVFILICAIVIASIGLNVNSTPVIIGAMLISPVMGPILGMGFSLATMDRELLRDSAKNFATMVIISIVASALLFLLSPLKLEHPTELLARTNPTIYDVLIALFGGFAGILEISRKEKGTVLSGVAIATALMPPLCTIGYGLSVLNWHYILGASYLFLINSIFIALATFLAVKYLKFPAVEADAERPKSRITKRFATVLLLIIIVPSVISAINIIRESNFNIHVSSLVAKNKSIGNSIILDYEIDYSESPATISLFMTGEKLSSAEKELIYRDAEEYGILREQIIFQEDASYRLESLSETEIIKDIYARNDRTVSALNDSIRSMRTKLNVLEENQIDAVPVFNELVAQYPEITNLVLTVGNSVGRANSNNDSTAFTGSTRSEQRAIIAILSSSDTLSQESQERIRRWLSARLSVQDVTLVFNVSD